MGCFRSKFYNFHCKKNIFGNNILLKALLLQRIHNRNKTFNLHRLAGATLSQLCPFRVSSSEISRKYSIVCFNPSSTFTFGDQPNSRRATDMSGLRCFVLFEGFVGYFLIYVIVIIIVVVVVVLVVASSRIPISYFQPTCTC